VLHLARIGTGQDAPWEVVGSRDTTLTLDRPAYGVKVSSPITVGGRITGVDESILVQMRQPSSERPLGTAPGVPAGGEHQPWSTRVTFRGATDPALDHRRLDRRSPARRRAFRHHRRSLLNPAC
jgi:hypothetical protein